LPGFATEFVGTDKIDSLTSLLDKTKGAYRVKVLLALSSEYGYTDYEKAGEFAQQAFELAKNVNDPEGVIRSLYELGSIVARKGDADLCLPYFSQGLEQSRKIRNDVLTAGGFYHMSHYFEMKNDFVQALEFLNQALPIYTRLGLRKEVKSCLSSFGNINKNIANYEEAVKYYFQALEIAESLNDTRGISILFTDIGNVYLLTSKYEDALGYFLKSSAIDHKNQDMEGVVVSLLNIGVVHQKTGAFKTAIVYFDSALVLARESKFRVDESILLGNIGTALKSQHKLDDALKYLFSALEIKMEIKRYGSAAHTCNNICETYLELNDPAVARKFALQAISLSTDVDINQQRVSYSLLAECDYRLGNFKNAYDHLQQADALKDSIFSTETAASMNELEVKYQTEKKEEEIHALVRDKEAAEFRRNAYVIAGVMVSFFLLLLYNRQRLKSRKNKELLEKEIEIDRMKSRFFANISHEFRTPLTLILGPLDDLLSTIEQVDIKKQLKVIQRNAHRLLSLVNQLLDLSKIESGKLRMNISTSDIIPVIKGVSMSFHSIAEQKDIALELDVPAGPVEMDYDREKLETILVNLLSNAFKFTPHHGRISIHCGIYNGERAVVGRGVLRIVVSDNGKGIPQEDLGFIFNRFYQSEMNQLLQHEGSGIGLALTKELVELHQGCISAKSALGVGTDITIELPMDVTYPGEKRADDQPPSRTEAPEIFDAAGEVIDISDDRAVVLVIEDHQEVGDYIKDTLGEKFAVIAAVDGEMGISKAIEQIPDLIISDVMMPKKDGFEVCKTLKNDEKTSHIPIILLTARSDSEDKIEGLMTKADDYITKPFVPRELLVRIQNLIESRKLLREKYPKQGVLRPKEIAANSVDEKFLDRLIEVVETHMGDETFNVEQLGREIAMSRSQLHRKLTALLGQGPNQFIRSFRLQRAHDLLKQNAATASEIAYRVGFSSPSYFTKCFHEQFGYTPSEVFT